MTIKLRRDSEAPLKLKKMMNSSTVVDSEVSTSCNYEGLMGQYISQLVVSILVHNLVVANDSIVSQCQQIINKNSEEYSSNKYLNIIQHILMKHSSVNDQKASAVQANMQVKASSMSIPPTRIPPTLSSTINTTNVSVSPYNSQVTTTFGRSNYESLSSYFNTVIKNQHKRKQSKYPTNEVNESKLELSLRYLFKTMTSVVISTTYLEEYHQIVIQNLRVYICSNTTSPRDKRSRQLKQINSSSFIDKINDTDDPESLERIQHILSRFAHFLMIYSRFRLICVHYCRWYFSFTKVTLENESKTSMFRNINEHLSILNLRYCCDDDIDDYIKEFQDHVINLFEISKNSDDLATFLLPAEVLEGFKGRDPSNETIYSYMKSMAYFVTNVMGIAITVDGIERVIWQQIFIEGLIYGLLRSRDKHKILPTIASSKIALTKLTHNTNDSLKSSVNSDANVKSLERTSLLENIQLIVHDKRIDQLTDYLDYLNSRAGHKQLILKSLLAVWKHFRRHQFTNTNMQEFKKYQDMLIDDMKKQQNTQVSSRATIIRKALSNGRIFDDKNSNLKRLLDEIDDLENILYQANNDAMLIISKINGIINE